MSLIIFDLFSGTGSATQAFKEAQQKVYTFELDTYFQADENVDVFDLTVSYTFCPYP